MKTRVINLAAHEAAAFHLGATMLVRECKVQPPDHESLQVGIIVSSTERGERGKFTFGWIDPHGSCRTIRGKESRLYVKAPWEPGDLLIGREAWFCYDYIEHDDVMMKTKVIYRADGEEYRYKSKDDRWRSSAVMPSHFARVRRIVESVSLKRCQDLTEGEIEAMKYDFREHNAKLWAENRFVWVTKVKELNDAKAA